MFMFSGPVEQVLVNITDITADSMLVYWKLPSTQYVSGFKVEIELLETSEKVQVHTSCFVTLKNSKV